MAYNTLTDHVPKSFILQLTHVQEAYVLFHFVLTFAENLSYPAFTYKCYTYFNIVLKQYPLYQDTYAYYSPAIHTSGTNSLLPEMVVRLPQNML
jgi:hypothetical protein